MSKENKVVIVLGMHRSGTSLLAQWLHTSGVSMGSQFLPASPSNPTGFFEDTAFLDFHISLLNERHLNYDVKTVIDISGIDSSAFIAAENLVSVRNSQHRQWGWKDPRTCLFIKLWKKVIPDAYYIILYRNHQEVVESLARRQRGRYVNGGNYFLWQWELLKMYRQRSAIFNHYLQVTNHYNRQVLKHTASIPSYRKLFLTINLLTEQTAQIRQYLTTQWGINIQDNKNKFQIRNDLFRRASVNKRRYSSEELHQARKIEACFQKLMFSPL